MKRDKFKDFLEGVKIGLLFIICLMSVLGFVLH